MVVAEAAAPTVAEEGAAISAVAGRGRVSAEVHVPVAQAALAGLLLARSGQEGRELTVIDLTVHDLMGCTVAEAWVPQVHVTARCGGRGTGRIQG
jgi:hypothetical protein